MQKRPHDRTALLSLLIVLALAAALVVAAQRMIVHPYGSVLRGALSAESVSRAEPSSAAPALDNPQEPLPEGGTDGQARGQAPALDPERNVPFDSLRSLRVPFSDAAPRGRASSKGDAAAVPVEDIPLQESDASAMEEPADEEPVEVFLSVWDFEDIEWDAWYVPFVEHIVAWGIAGGYRDDHGHLTGFFGPGDPVTVGQFLKMTMYAGRIDTNSCPGVEALQPGESWVAPYVLCAQAMNVRLIRQQTTMERPILRAEAVGLLHDVFESDVPPLPSAFRDTNFHPLRSDIAYAAARQIVAGTMSADGEPTGFFRPNEPLTRAEAAKMLYLMILTEQIGDNGNLTPVVMHLTAKNFEFSPSLLVVRHGQPVTLHIKNAGQHTFTIKDLKLESILRKPEETVIFTPERAGTFRITCTMPGHAEAGMIGTLIVR